MADEQIDVKIVADASSVKPQTDQVKEAIAAVGAAATGTQSGVASLSAEVRQAAGDAMALRQSAANVTPALEGTSSSANQTKSAMRDLTSQMGEVAGSLAEGANPMALLAQHGAKLMGTIAEIRNVSTGFVAFLGGPWGAAIMGAVGVLGALWMKHREAAEAATIQAGAVDELRASVDRLNAASEKNNHTTISGIQSEIRNSQQALRQGTQQREALIRQLQAAKAELANIMRLASSPWNPDGGAGLYARGAGIEEKIAGINRLLAKNNEEIQKASSGLRTGQSQLGLRKAQVETNPALARDEAINQLKLDFQRPGSKMSQTAYDAEMKRLHQPLGITAPLPVPTGGSITTGKTSRTGEWEADLAAQKLAIQAKAEAEGNFREMSQQQEADYWGKILQRSDLSNAERLGIEKKYFDLNGDIRKKDFDAHVAALTKELDAAQGNGAERLRIATQIAAETKDKYGEESNAYKAAQERIVQITKETAEQRRQIEAQTAEASRQRQLDDVAREEATAKFQVELGVKTNDQLLADQTGFEERRHRLQMAPLYGDRDRAKEDGKDLVRIGALNNQIEAAEQQHQQKMTAIQRQRTLERTQIERQAIAAAASLWGQNIARLATLQQGFGATLRSIYSGMVGIVSDALGQVLQKWTKAELSKTAATLTGSGQRTAAEATAGAATTGISALSAIKQIAHSAAVAAARVYASIAQIPIVGPVLAPAAAAAALYGVIKLGQSIFSARDGIGSVPYDDAPFLLHRNEMVLPANLASPLRAMLQGGSAANGNAPFAANDGGGHSFHYNDYTEKGQSDAQIMAKRMVFAKAMKRAYREGAFAGTPIAF